MISIVLPKTIQLNLNSFSEKSSNIYLNVFECKYFSFGSSIKWN